jgi:YD repeat-containing protein
VGNLTRVTHPGGLGVTTLSYDLGGRKSAMSDPDLGSWRYVYDRQGKLVSQTDGCGTVTTLGYDTLQRLTGKSYLKGSTPTCTTASVNYSVSYRYDGSPTTVTASRGQLTQVKYSNNSHQKELSYNSLGLLASAKVTIAGGAGSGYTTS